MLGLALEGGGAKGAYEIGAYRALTELGYRFDVICGVSIGAINAALLAQGDCERAAEFWETMSNDDLFSEKDRGFLEVINRQVNLNTLSALKANIKTALENGGIDLILRLTESGAVRDAMALAEKGGFGCTTYPRNLSTSAKRLHISLTGRPLPKRPAAAPRR